MDWNTLFPLSSRRRPKNKNQHWNNCVCQCEPAGCKQADRQNQSLTFMFPLSALLSSEPQSVPSAAPPCRKLLNWLLPLSLPLCTLTTSCMALYELSAALNTPNSHCSPEISLSPSGDTCSLWSSVYLGGSSSVCRDLAWVLEDRCFTSHSCTCVWKK